LNGRKLIPDENTDNSQHLMFPKIIPGKQVRGLSHKIKGGNALTTDQDDVLLHPQV